MRMQTVLIVALALVFGISAVVGVNLAMRQPIASETAETVTVVTTVLDIPRASMIRTDQLTTRECPKEMVPPGTISRIEDAVDRVAINTLVKGEWLLERDLVKKGGGRGLAALIPPGQRAVTILTPTVAVGVAGFILPSNHVDVLLTLTDQANDSRSGGALTFTLLRNVEILAVDQRMEASAENKVDSKELRSVTLLVSMEQAARLTLGQTRGVLHLSLRSPDDKGTDEPPPTTLSQLRAPMEPRRDAVVGATFVPHVGSSRVDLQACKLEYSIVSPK